MVVRQVYDAFSNIVASGFVYWKDTVIAEYANFYLNSQTALNNLQNSSIGLAFLPVVSIALWGLATVNYLLQLTLPFVTFIINNIDILNYLILTSIYLIFLLFFGIRALFIAKMTVGYVLFAELVLIQPPLIVLFIFVFMSLRGEPNPGSATKEVCLDFLDYWFINYEVSLYFGLLGLMWWLGFVDRALEATGFSQFVFFVFAFTALSPMILVAYKTFINRINFLQAVDETRELVKSLLRLS